MTDIEALLAALAAADVKLWVHDGKLRVNAPEGALTPELRARMTAHREQLMAFAAGQSVEAAPQITRRPEGQPIPLTLGQQRLWALSQIDRGSSVYNVPIVFQLQGPLRRQALEGALTAVIGRHEALRTVFEGDSIDDVVQVVQPAAPVQLAVADASRDLSSMAPPAAAKAVQQLLRREVARAFDLRRGPLWRARLIRLRPRLHVLCITVHHIVFDGVSRAIFLEELAAAYRAATDGLPPPASTDALQFGDYAAWQRKRLDGDALARQAKYWERRLQGASALQLPNDRPRVPGKGPAASLPFRLPPELSARLKALATAEQVSLFALLLAGFSLLLRGYSGQDDLVVCSPMASRENTAVERMVGYFNNLVAMRTMLDGNPRFRDVLGQVKRASIEAFDNQYMPLQEVAKLPALARTPLTRAMFSFQEASSHRLELPGLQTRALAVRKDAADFEIALYTESDGDTITGVLDFHAQLFGKERMRTFLRRFTEVLSAVCDDPDARIDGLPSFGRTLADIEGLFAALPQIERVAVVRQPAAGTLLAYLVLNEHDVPDLAAIRAYAAKVLPDYRVPKAFIPVDELPLRPDGTVDVAALPAPRVDRSGLDTAYETPRTELEASLARLWRKVLWLDHDVGIHDRFRDLGGHSLISVQLVTEIERELGIRVPSSALSRINTVGEMAAALENPQAEEEAVQTPLPDEIYRGLRSHTASWAGVRSSPASVMVGLNTQGTREPLFWCLQRYQELTQLARYLGEDQPVYGMRSGNRVMDKTPDNIALLASHYVGEILAVRPTGPFVLGGNCQAALIAFQIAVQLQARGHEVSLLVLHEKFVPQAYAGRVAMMFGASSSYHPKWRFDRPEAGWRKYYGGPVQMRTVPGGHGEFFREPNVQALTDAIRGFMAEAANDTFAAMPGTQPGGTGQRLLPGHCLARLEAAPGGPLRLAAGGQADLQVRVHNLSAVPWLGFAESGLTVSARWCDASGRQVGLPLASVPLAEGVAAGGSATVTLPVTTPASPGDHVLEVDVVEQGIGWFRDTGSEPLRLTIGVGA